MNNGQYHFSGFTMLPPVVKNLLIINGIFYLATVTLNRYGIDLTNLLGLHYFAAENFQFYQIITYMFMHGSFTHLFFNMFALWMFGYILELTWGPKRFLIYYFVCGIGAALVHYLIFFIDIQPTVNAINEYLSSPSTENLTAFLGSDKFTMPSREFYNYFKDFATQYDAIVNINPNEATEISISFMREYKEALYNAPVIVGASGAVYGILLAFGMMFPNQLIFLYFAIPIKAKYFVILYGAIELISGIFNSGGNIAHFAHLGGMIFGFLLIKLWKRKGEL